MLTFRVPPGIGDFSAMYSKLVGIDRAIKIVSAEDQPNRLSPFLDILPRVINGGYSRHSADTSLALTLPAGTDIRSLADGDYYLSINHWLEMGGKVSDWIPGPIDYHYKMNADPSLLAPLNSFLEKSQPRRPLVGVYCSAYGNSRHWGFWGQEDWRAFLELVRHSLPKTATYLFIGAEYDVQIADYLYSWMDSIGCNCHLLLGAFHIAATIQLIGMLDYFFVFPSGLGFLADVVKTPHLMWFPQHLEPMMGTFCDPEQYESKRSLHRIFTTPTLAFEDWRQYGLRFMEERCPR